MKLVGTILHYVFERQAVRESLDVLSDRLEHDVDDISERIQSAEDTAGKRAIARHVIGIERWGAMRLRSLLGQPLVLDECDIYYPTESLAMPALAQEFLQTRAETLSLLDSLRDLQDCRVRHNDIGDLSVRAWFAYLHSHAGMESKKLRG